ncbi:MAG: hypothetical protein AAFW74_02910, partial [Pseudomonadota bacterium]
MGNPLTNNTSLRFVRVDDAQPSVGFLISTACGNQQVESQPLRLAMKSALIPSHNTLKPPIHTV